MRQWILLCLPGILVGCGANPETRRETKALPSTETASTGFPRLDPPAASDGSARTTATQIIAAHTANNPAVIDKLKQCLFGREGKHISVDSPLAGLPVHFKLSASWPDRGRYVWTGMAQFPVTVRLVDKQAFRDIPNPALMPPLSEKQFEDLHGHLYADWLQLLVPLADPEAILAKGPEFKLQDKTFSSVRIWRTGKPQAIIYYDPATYRVMRIAYDGRENGLPTHIELAMSDHQMTNGFLLAHRVYVRMNGRDFMEFDKATLEFPKEHAAKLFTEP